MIKFQQSHALTSHFESFWNIVHLWYLVANQLPPQAHFAGKGSGGRMLLLLTGS